MRAFTVLLLLAGCLSVAVEAAENSDNSIPENWYRLHPWAEQPPVDVYRRVAAVQSALGGLQSAANSYSAAIQAQAAAQNQRVLMQAELARVEAMQPKPEPRRSNFATRGTPEEIDAAARARGQTSGAMSGYSVPYTGLTAEQSIKLGNAAASGAVSFDKGWISLTKSMMGHAPK